jgi:hypothetical protein
MFADAAWHTETELTLETVISLPARQKYGNAILSLLRTPKLVIHLRWMRTNGNAILSRSTHASGNYKERAIRVLNR